MKVLIHPGDIMLKSSLDKRFKERSLSIQMLWLNLKNEEEKNDKKNIWSKDTTPRQNFVHNIKFPPKEVSQNYVNPGIYKWNIWIFGNFQCFFNNFKC